MSETLNPLLPVAFGNEYETSQLLITHRPGQDGGRIMRYASLQDVRLLIPHDLKPGNDQNIQFLLNGSKAYNGGSDKESVGFSSLLEIATAEALSLEDLVVHTQVTDEMLLNGALQALMHLRQRGMVQGLSGIRGQKRATDGKGNSWGHHDNFGYVRQTINRLNDRHEFGTSLAQFCNARTLIVGGGNVLQDGNFGYAQKLEHVHDFHRTNFHPRHYRFDDMSSLVVYPRLEIGSIDPNLSDWAAWQRVGGMAVFLAIFASGHFDKLRKHLDLEASEEDILNVGRMTNRMHISSRGEVSLSKEQLRHLDLLEKVGQVYIEHVAKEVDVPVYEEVAEEMLEFVEDFRAVDRGDERYTVLGDRADWPNRLETIESRMKRTGRNLFENMGDTQSRQDDYVYDYYGIAVDEKASQDLEDDDPKKYKITTGVGHRLREQGHFRYKADPEKVADAYVMPRKGRGRVRACVLRSGRKPGRTVINADWHYGRISAKSAVTGKDTEYQINMMDVVSDTVPTHIYRVGSRDTGDMLEL